MQTPTTEETEKNNARQVGIETDAEGNLSFRLPAQETLGQVAQRRGVERLIDAIALTATAAAVMGLNKLYNPVG